MIKITFVTPYGILTRFACDRINTFTKDDVQLEVVQAVGEAEVDSLELASDAVISRGATFVALRERLEGKIPVIELQVSGYDVISAVHRCKQLYHPKTIAVIGSHNMVDGVQGVADALGVSLLCKFISRERDADRYIQESVRRGVDVIIGGAMVYEKAQKQGIAAVLIESGEESVLHALDEAIHTARITRRERAAAERMRLIMDTIHEGIVSIDEHGVVTTCNKAAAQALGGNADRGEFFVGKPVKDVLPGSEILSVLGTGEKRLGSIYKKGVSVYVENLLPISVNGASLGVVSTFQKASNLQELEGQVRSSMHKKGHVARYTFADCRGDSPALRRLIEQARKFSRVDANVLIFGETGTGKEVFSQSMHNASLRSRQPFVAVNCAALPENLLESELFGYVGGAFTGAAKGGKIGLFELAHNGTIFLDEVSEIPLSLQGRLLRVLQEQEVMRLGDDRVIPVNVRVIAATNKSLKEQARAGLFRKDLLYRLDVLELTVPPLRERRGDVRLLARHFLDECGRRLRGHPVYPTAEAEERLAAYDWPGNVRELLNVCERISVLAHGSEAQADDADCALGSCEPPEAPRRMVPRHIGPACVIPHSQTEAVSSVRLAATNAIVTALNEFGGNKTQAAKALGISRTTLWRKLRTLESSFSSSA
jgi:transcriptional regulator with PAS, ATPase and Fis domain